MAPEHDSDESSGFVSLFVSLFVYSFLVIIRNENRTTPALMAVLINQHKPNFTALQPRPGGPVSMLMLHLIPSG